MNENWIGIKGYEGIYEVSSVGNVRSLDRFDASGHRRKGRMLKLMNDAYGYKVVKLSKNGIAKAFKVHRLVAQAFIPNEEDKYTVNHINEIKHDNRVENLEWLCAKENSRYGTAQIRSGINRRKPVKGTHLETGEVIRFDSASSANRHGFTGSNITSCCRGRLKHHKGYEWEYDFKNKEKLKLIS